MIMVMKDKATEDNFEQFPSVSGGIFAEISSKNKILITNTATWMPIFWRRYFLFKRARNVPPTLVLRAQCSTYLYTPNLHNHERSEWSWWMMMMMKKKSFFDFAETWHTCRPRYIKFPNFRISWLFFRKLEKIPILSLKIGKFRSKSHYLDAHFWRK